MEGADDRVGIREREWEQVQLDDAGSAIVHQSNMQVVSYSEGPVDQRTKDERTAMRRAKVQERRSQHLDMLDLSRWPWEGGTG